MNVMEFSLLNEAASISDNDGIIELIAPGKTDFFIDICSDYRRFNAPFYFTLAENDFIFRCKVNPEFNETYDAGGIIAHVSDDKWIKFAFEKTDLGYPSVVSVITNNVSDDCNGEIINVNEIWMQIVRKDHNWCLHYSNDKMNWRMVRYFRFETQNVINIGISCQSPLGRGCRAVFSDLELLKNHYSNIRKAI